MQLQRAVGRQGGEYFYFFCARKQSHECTTRYSPIEMVEEAVVRRYATIHFAAGFVAALRAKLYETLETRPSQPRCFANKSLKRSPSD